MNASYKIALVVAVGLLILVAGYYATRDDDRGTQSASDVSNAPAESAIAQTSSDNETPQTPAGRGARRAAPDTRPITQDVTTPAAPPAARPHGRTVRPMHSAADVPGQPEVDDNPTEPGIGDTPAVVELGPPPATLPRTLAEARRFGTTSPPTGDETEVETPDEDSAALTEPAQRPTPAPVETVTQTPQETPDTQEPIAQPERPTTANDRDAIPATYTIQAGDVLVNIAQQFYGNEAAWEAIAQANPTVDPTRLQIGQVLRMPGRSATERQRTEPPASTPGQRDRYTVKAGDNLYRIAEQFYDDAEKWDVIYNHNRAAIGDDPAKLKLGMTLVIPPAVNGSD